MYTRWHAKRFGCSRRMMGPNKAINNMHQRKKSKRKRVKLRNRVTRMTPRCRPELESTEKRMKKALAVTRHCRTEYNPKLLEEEQENEKKNAINREKVKIAAVPFDQTLHSLSLSLSLSLSGYPIFFANISNIGVSECKLFSAALPSSTSVISPPNAKVVDHCTKPSFLLVPDIVLFHFFFLSLCSI